jgi:hypothetical protein
MRTRNRGLVVALTGAALWAGAAAAASTAGSAEFDLVEVPAEAAMQALRALADSERLERVDSNTIRVRGTPKQLDLAGVVVELVDADRTGDVVSREAEDGSVVARFDLKGVSSRQAVRHLRAMSIREVAVVPEVSALLVRGSGEQIEAATQRMEVLRRESAGR